MSEWMDLGRVLPRELGEARAELHWAAQLVALGFGRSLVEPRGDDSHTALTWSGGGWVSEESGGLRAGLRVEQLALTVGRQGEAPRSFSLFGKSLVEGLLWLQSQVGELGGPADQVKLGFHYEMPEHPVGKGAAFRAELQPGHSELGRWFGNAALLLRALGPDASPIRSWPHHFDLATLLPAGTREDGIAQTIGVGLSPGDESYPEPYLYVSPWPRPESPELPRLPRGEWQTESFFGAVLTTTELLRAGEQESAAREFCQTAIAASRHLFSG